ncbi:MAG TPA: copper transporter [Streptosporangiaceae bacterium]|nr:copper transporter [Streptosporangiaceae bacterium]
MIDFRYHLVSIVAVFLALAIGIVVGATALKPKTEDFFDRASRLEEQQISSARAKIRGLQSQVGSDQAFAQSAAPVLLANLLPGQRVVLVTAPGADGGTVSGITAALKLAGAKVIGQAQLQPAFFDTSPSAQNSLDVLAQKVGPTTVIPGSQPTQAPVDSQIAGQQEAAQVLAPALVTKSSTDLPASQTSTILDGFAAQGYLQLSPAALAPPQATLAVVVIPSNPPASDSNPANLALLSLADELAASSRGVVVAGPIAGSGPGSAIDELVSGGTSIQVSSVDNADTPVGQVIVAQALASLLAGQKPKAYGLDTGAVPTPAPTPAVSPSAVPAATPTTRAKIRA